MDQDKVSIFRREVLLGAACSGAIVLVPKKLLAQEYSIPEVEITLNYLSSEMGMRLLLSQYSFAFELARLTLVQFDTGGLGDDDGLQRIYSRDENAVTVFSVLFQMGGADGETLRSQAIEAMSEGSDPLDENRERHSLLLANFTAVVSETGANPDAEIIRSATESLTHVERIARTVINGLGLCDIFPFSTRIFCESP